MTSTLKPIKEGYLTKKGAVVGKINIQLIIIINCNIIIFYYFFVLDLFTKFICFINDLYEDYLDLFVLSYIVFYLVFYILFPILL